MGSNWHRMVSRIKKTTFQIVSLYFGIGSIADYNGNAQYDLCSTMDSVILVALSTLDIDIDQTADACIR